eukprot:776127_1
MQQRSCARTVDIWSKRVDPKVDEASTTPIDGLTSRHITIRYCSYTNRTRVPASRCTDPSRGAAAPIFSKGTIRNSETGSTSPESASSDAIPIKRRQCQTPLSVF